MNAQQPEERYAAGARFMGERVREALGRFNNPCEPVTELVRHLVEEVLRNRAADAEVAYERGVADGVRKAVKFEHDRHER